MRIFSVSMPFRNTQALNGLMVGPEVRKKPYTLSIFFLLPSTAPPSTRPCPSMYLVAEWITISAPNCSGRCRIGVQKQLSTASSAPQLLAITEIAAMSEISVSGLDGVSRKNNLVLGRIVVEQLEQGRVTAQRQNDQHKR